MSLRRRIEAVERRLAGGGWCPHQPMTTYFVNDYAGNPNPDPEPPPCPCGGARQVLRVEFVEDWEGKSHEFKRQT